METRMVSTLVRYADVLSAAPMAPRPGWQPLGCRGAGVGALQTACRSDSGVRDAAPDDQGTNARDCFFDVKVKPV